MALTLDYVLNKFSMIHGDKYDYSKVEYSGDNCKVSIGCPEGHEFLMTPSNHYHKSNPQGCPECSGKGPGKNQQDIFERKASLKWGNLFTYGEYRNSSTPMEMTCTVHDTNCVQRPADHIAGKNPCKECVKIKRRLCKPSPYNITKALRGDFEYPSYVYVVKLYSSEESFIKIGISKNVPNRIKEFITKGYLVEILATRYFESCNNAVIKEHSMHTEYSNSRIVPLLLFKGSCNECFSMDVSIEAVKRLESNEL